MSQKGISNPGVTSPGAFVLIQSQTVPLDAQVTSLVFNYGITPEYNNYFFLITNFSYVGFNGNVTGIQISSDGGLTYETTGYYDANFGATPVTAMSLINQQFDGYSVISICQPSYLCNFTSGSGYLMTNGTAGSGYGYFPPTSHFYGGGVSVVGCYPNNFVVNAFKYICDDGTPFSGTFSLYGIKE
jgi:hypothetical protein